MHGEVDVEKVNSWYTILDTVFGRISLFDIDYSNFGVSGQAVTEIQDATTPQTDAHVKNPQIVSAEPVNSVIKRNVAQWFYAIRNLTIIILLLVLIYIGIKMALSSISSERAQYKKMFIHWVTSVILIFCLQYIIFFSIALSNSLVNILAKAGENIDNIETALIVGKNQNGEEVYINGNIVIAQTGVLDLMQRVNGWSIIYVSIIYWVLVFYQVKFFFLYLKRFLTIGFLIVISPLISVTYAIDKAGDGRAQAFTTWIKEFLVNVFIQPLHAILYLVFMSTAYEIVYVAPLIALIFLAGLSRGEKVVKEILNIRGLTSIHSMSETMGMKLFKKR